MLKIGLTGGIGSGKSKVSFVLAKLGSYIFDADTEAKKLLNNNENIQKDIISEFGSDVLDYTGKIDRKKLAKVAFTTATYGINTPGTVYRMDNVPLYLRPAFESPFPSDEMILRAIKERVCELRGITKNNNKSAAA